MMLKLLVEVEPVKKIEKYILDTAVGPTKCLPKRATVTFAGGKAVEDELQLR